MNIITYSLLIAAVFILVAALSRLVLYPHNFSPIIGMAVFGGAMIADKKLAFALPLFAMLLSDILFQVSGIAEGFWGWGQAVGYGILGLITVISFNLKKITVLNVAGFSILSSVIFFLLSNSSFFVIDNTIYHTYPQTFGGYLSCLAAGLPFLKTGVVADLIYSGILFGSYFLIQKYALRKVVA